MIEVIGNADKKDTAYKEHLVRSLLIEIGENPDREGLKGTPERVVRMWKEIYRGYDKTQKPKVTTFTNGKDGITCDEMVMDSGDFYSQCEHHVLPFFGKYHFAYIPNPKGKILGLSKVARVVDYFSAKLQIQERLAKEILNEIEEALTIYVPHDIGDRPDDKEIIKPLGLAITMDGEHLCKTMRGVKKKGTMRNTELRGVFKEDAKTRSEFMSWVNR